MNNRTPAPWKVVGGTVVMNLDNKVVATVPETPHRETRNNAVLISKSPDMVGAIKGLLDRRAKDPNSKYGRMARAYAEQLLREVGE